MSIIIRRIIRSSRRFYTTKPLPKDENFLAKHLAQKIVATGPITVAEYMKEVLTNPASGYYMNKDMFGDKGDFITSPEISQMFGEMLAVWLLNEWRKIGSPKPFQIVELGPGRGTLSADILRVFSHFSCLHGASLSLVEVSPFLSDIQAKTLCERPTNSQQTDGEHYRRGVASVGIPVRWYRQLQDVPKLFTLFVAHEFFDALPIHKFHKSYNGFKEVLIDVDGGKAVDEPKFRYILARDETPMLKTLLKNDEKREHVEVSPDSLLLYEELCQRVYQDGGIALICDYGHDGDGLDTFRAFKRHKQVDPLECPGSADLTADVDFSLIREAANKHGGVLAFGPTTQRDFLLSIGLEERFKSLTSNSKNKLHFETLETSYSMLIDSDKMGERFKFLALFPAVLKNFFERYPVVGFS